MEQLIKTIDEAFNLRSAITPSNVDVDVKEAVLETIDLLDRGEVRVAEKQDGEWVVNEWLKKAVLLFFRISDNNVMHGDFTNFFDKVPTKYSDYDFNRFHNHGTRVVPPATVRKGAYVADGVILMPCYVNIGAYIDTGTLVDTWATVASCAQIGKNVHISGGAGIGGVLEPLQATPTIIEDDVFIGARSEVVEGVIVEKGAVLSMGVFIGQSTRIYDRETGEVSYGRVPAGAVVVPGSLPAADGSHSLSAAIIVKRVDEQTRSKVSINELLRDG